jgi:hypothetical protein
MKAGLFPEAKPKVVAAVRPRRQRRAKRDAARFGSG